MARQVTLIVEDGSIVANANSFVDEVAIVSYALSRGVTLPFDTDAEQDQVAVLGIQAADYLRAQHWRGQLVDDSQTMPWPRKNTGVTNPLVTDDTIPFNVKEAQLQLTLLANGGTVLIPSYEGSGFIIRERVGPIDTVYSEKTGVSTDGFPIFPGITALLDPFLLGNYEGFKGPYIWSIGTCPTNGC